RSSGSARRSRRADATAGRARCGRTTRAGPPRGSPSRLSRCPPCQRPRCPYPRSSLRPHRFPRRSASPVLRTRNSGDSLVGRLPCRMRVMPTNPISAWKSLREGNERFVSGNVLHPSQGIADRARLASGQHPKAILLGCGDSRVAGELIFDQGLGDMFVVRTAGHGIDSSVLGSIEYGVHVLNVPLIVVLGHDSCGAVKATVEALDGGEVPGGFIRSVVERVTPSILAARREGLGSVDELEARHVVETS